MPIPKLQQKTSIKVTRCFMRQVDLKRVDVESFACGNPLPALRREWNVFGSVCRCSRVDVVSIGCGLLGEALTHSGTNL